MKAILAPWVLPVAQQPISDAAIVVDDSEKVAYVGPRDHMPKCDAVEEITDFAILPGLINAHTHLEFSDLKQPLGEPGMKFTQWISEVLACRGNQTQTDTTKQSAIELGIQESLQHGIAAIGEIATSPVDAVHYAKARGCSLTVFQEALGADSSTYDDKISDLKINSQELNEKEMVAAISPHAPYSVPPSLLGKLMELAGESNLSVAMHVAETLEEREFIEHRTGPFVDMLKTFGVWQPEMYADKDSILKILESLSRAKRSLVIHGNYLNEDELKFIGSMKKRMSIVFCPRTHRYFRHSNYPLEAILTQGINLAVGTDSRASNPDLNLMEDLREIRRQFPDLSPETILRLGTVNGAVALGLENRLGTLEQGRAGRFCLAKLTDLSDPYSWLT